MARSVLIVKLAAIGDVIMALPMVTAVRARHPDARITWMVGHVTAPLLRHVEGIDEVVSVDESAMLTGRSPVKLLAVTEAWRKVAGRRFDAIYIGHTDQRYNVLGWPVLASERHWLASKRSRGGIVPGRSYADEYVRLVTGVDDYRAVAYPPPKVHVPLPDSLADRIAAGNREGRPLVAITPGGARNVARESPLRRWPLARYAELARELEVRGYRVVVTGHSADGWVRRAFRWGSVIDLIGATNLPSLAALLERCALVIGHDSGPLHLARLVGTPVVVLLGPTPPTMFFREEEHRVRVLWPARVLPCAPCYTGFEFATCGNNLCMQMIDVAAVLERACSMLESAAER